MLPYQLRQRQLRSPEVMIHGSWTAFLRHSATATFQTEKRKENKRERKYSKAMV
jgi:hypothetical protein